jgi:hypothetical protein
VIYKRLPDADGMLPMSYEADVLPIMNEQLQRAGVRLAAAPNRCSMWFAIEKKWP